MKRTILALVFVLFASSAFAEPSSEALLKARIVQLEAQLQEAVRRINLLTAQLSEAQQPAIATDLSEKRAEAEKAARANGCDLDWNTQPPSCKTPVIPETKP